MNHDQNATQEQTPDPQAGPTIDPSRIEQAMNTFRADQNLPLAIVAGAASALVGAGLWALITVLTGYQIGFMAIGVGILVGLAVRLMGKGLDKPFGFIGAGFALLGCGIGNLLAVAGMVSIEQGVTFFQVLGALNIELARELMVVTFSPIDLLFYGIALYEGYRFSFRQITEEELTSVLPEARAAARDTRAQAAQSHMG